MCHTSRLQWCPFIRPRRAVYNDQIIHLSIHPYYYGPLLQKYIAYQFKISRVDSFTEGNCTSALEPFFLLYFVEIYALNSVPRLACGYLSHSMSKLLLNVNSGKKNTINEGSFLCNKVLHPEFKGICM